jgi:hypothetical protein
MGMLGAGAAVAGVPVAALLFLLAMGWAPVAPTVFAIGMTVLAAMLFALRWSRDVEMLSGIVRRVGADEPPSQPGHSPVLPGMQRLAGDLERLARRTTARSALIEQLRRADGTVVERLPDPLIVLAATPRASRRDRSCVRLWND